MLDALIYVWNPNTRINDGNHLFIGSNANPIKVGFELANLYNLYHNTKFYIEDLIERELPENVISFLINYHIIIPDHLQISCQTPFLNKISSSNFGRISDIIFERNTKNFIVGLPYANDIPYAYDNTKTLSQSMGPNCVYRSISDHLQRTKFLGNINYDIFFDDYKKLVEMILYLIHLVIFYKKRIIFLGGEHTLTYFITMAHSKVVQNKIKIIQLDAHHDMYSNGSFYKRPNHANFMSFLIEEGWLDYLVQVGTRDLTKPISSSSSIKLEVTEANRLIDGNILEDTRLGLYGNQLSIDIDILDPKLVSDVVAPITGGWALDCLLEEIKFIFREVPIHIMDICEICNGRDGSSKSDSAAAAGRILAEIDRAAI